LGWLESMRIGSGGCATDAAFAQLVDQVEGVAHGAAKTVEGMHDEDVPGAGVVERGAQPGPVGGGAGLLVHIDPLEE
jgi:hypothetical protein